MPTAIEFNHVSKQYRLGLVSTKTLSHDLDRWWKMNILGKEDPYLKIGETNDRSTKGESDYVWALKDIDFKVEQGDVIGIIGKNGAGKSTLLKLLSKVTGPTTGSIKARGRIGALLEVGTGFHSEMTGRENIFLNGAILGMSKQEVAQKLDEIVDFSGCERYLDTPVKRYSSGMMVRLGFAVAAHLDPEILVVDEVLAVGDAEFQKKAIGKMQDVSKGEGRTVLFVSHNMASVRALCNNGIVLNNGSIQFSGRISECLSLYLKDESSLLSCYQEDLEPFRKCKHLSRDLEYINIRLINDAQHISSEEPLIFEMTCKRNNPKITKCQFGVIFINSLETASGGCYSKPIDISACNQIFKVRFTISYHQLAKGRYKLNFNISSFNYITSITDYDIISRVISFNVDYVDKEHKTPFVVWPDLGNNLYQHSLLEII